MKKAIIALMAALLFAVNMQVQGAENYNLYVAGNQVTSSNINKLSQLKGVKGGSITYDPSENVLTLNNAIIEVTEGQGISLGVGGITVKIVGKNTIKGGVAALHVTAAATITGAGQLMLDGQEYGIRLINRITRLIINGGAVVKAKGGYMGIFAQDFGNVLGITGESTQLYAFGNEGAICNFATIGINEPLEIIRPFNAKVVEGTVVDTQGEIVKGEWVAIKKKVTPTKTLTFTISKRLMNTDDLSEDQKLALDCLVKFNVLKSVANTDPNYITYSYQEKNLLALSENNLTVFPNVSSANNVTYNLTNENHNALEITEDGVIPLEEYKTVKLAFNLSAPSQTKTLTFTKRLHEKDEFDEASLGMVEIMSIFGALGLEASSRNVLVTNNGKNLLAITTDGNRINVFPGVTSADNVSCQLNTNHHLLLISMLGYDPYADCNQLQVKFNVAKPNESLKVSFPVGDTPTQPFNNLIEKKVTTVMGLALFGVLNYSVGLSSEIYLKNKSGKTLFILAKDVVNINVPDDVTDKDNFTWNITDEQHTRMITEFGFDPIANYSSVNVCFGVNDMVATDIPNMGSHTDHHPSSPLYTIQGQRVQQPQKAGIYIRNGRKVIIR
ncbi:MAG: hypothetical protein J6T43_02625 [Prevotella sp.]|nr:hypothetical protein [Prevotella sp.]